MIGMDLFYVEDSTFTFKWILHVNFSIEGVRGLVYMDPENLISFFL